MVQALAFCGGSLAADAAVSIRKTDATNIERSIEHSHARQNARSQVALRQALKQDQANLERQLDASGPTLIGAIEQPCTMLNDIGYLKSTPSPALIRSYAAELKSGHIRSGRAAELHLWLGEYKLAHDSAPASAEVEFQASEAISSKETWTHGAAQYDEGLALFYEGAYGDAARSFYHLLHSGPAIGFSRVSCMLMWKHAGAAAEYHLQRSRMGIPEPPRLDPNCALAAVATCARHLGLASDFASIKRVCKVTGEGSNLHDVVEAGQKLGLSSYPVISDDVGLIHLPKPLVAYVEHDHFIAVTTADKTGVTYLCSDCGAWPGGEVHLTWKQWRMMDAGIYAVLVHPKSKADAQVAYALSTETLKPISTGQNVAVATGGFHSSRLPILSHHIMPMMGEFGDAHDLLSGHVTRFIAAGTLPGCGLKLTSGEPNPNANCPSGGEPVNLATGEEQHTPAPDITVYNPDGPAVIWSRVYDSLRNPGQDIAIGDQTYEDSDFGVGWSQSYNIMIVPYSSSYGNMAVLLPNGAHVPFTSQAGACPMSPDAHINVTLTNGVYTVGASDGTQWIMHLVPNTANDYQLAQILDRFGNALDFEYNAQPPAFSYADLVIQSNNTQVASNRRLFQSSDVNQTLTITGGAGFTPGQYTISSVTSGIATLSAPVGVAGSEGGQGTLPLAGLWQLLSSINDDHTGNPLLTIQRTGDGSGNIASVTDCYGRSVYYHVQTIANSNIPQQIPQSYQELDSVSEIVQTCTQSPDLHYVYGYTLVANGDPGSGGNGEHLAFLNTIQTPSPTGTGMSTFTINYNSTTEQVASTKDGNNNQLVYTTPDVNGSPDPSETTVTAENSQSVTVPGASYTVAYDTNFNETGRTDGAGNTIETIQYAPGELYCPQFVIDGNGNTWVYSYGHYSNQDVSGWGNLTSVISPRGRVTQKWAITTQYSGPVGGQPGSYVDYYGNVYECTQSNTASASNYPSATGSPWEFLGVEGATGLPFPGTTTTMAYANVDSGNNGDPKNLSSLSTETVTDLEGQTPVTRTVLSMTYYPVASNSAAPIETVSTPTPGDTSTGPGNPLVTTTYTWDSLGNPLTLKTPGNPVASSINTTYNYTTDGTYTQQDKVGQPITITDNITSPAPNVTHLRYDDKFGNLLSFTDANGNETQFQYDLANSLSETIYPQTDQQGSGYSSVVNNYLYPGGPLMSTQEYDESGAAIRQASYNYDQVGNVLSTTATLLPSTSTQTLGSATYDCAYRLESESDGAGNTTSYYYNAQGYLNAVTYPGYTGSTPAYSTTTGTWSNISGSDSVTYPTYDLDGNPTEKIDGNDVTTIYQYQDQESKLTEILPNATESGGVWSSSDATLIGYDNFGHIRSISNGANTTACDLDNRGLPTEVDTTSSNSAAQSTQYGPTRAVEYVYNPDGSVKTATFGVLGGTAEGAYFPTQGALSGNYGYEEGYCSYGYDADGRMTSSQTAYDPNSTLSSTYNLTQSVATFTDSASWSYWPNGQIKTQTLPNGAETTYGYTAKGELNSLVTVAGSTQLSDFTTIVHDGVSNIKSASETVGGTGGFQGSISYVNDALDQLTGESYVRTNGSVANYANSSAYDDAFNPTELRSEETNSFDDDNELTGFYASNGAYTSSFEYDGNGNPTTYKGSTLGFDAFNELTSYESGGSTVTFAYNPDGRRTMKSSSSGTTYYTSGVETDGDFDLNAIDEVGPTGVYGRRTSTGGTYYSYDEHGNPVQMLNSSAGITVDNYFDAYGARISSGTPTDPHSYYLAQAGYYGDPETGLELLGQRYYDPQTGRFINRDPVGSAGGNNLYGYCGANPMNEFDAMGLDPSPDGFDVNDGASWTNPWEYAQVSWHYLGAEGASFAQAFNPVAMYHGAVGIIQLGQQCGAGYALKTAGMGMVHGFTDWATSNNTTDAGSSMGNLLAAVTMYAGPKASCLGAFGKCFVAGTLVQMADGSTKPIQKVKIGDEVISRDPGTGKTEARKVVGTKIRYAPLILNLKFENSKGKTVDSIECTPEHPFYVNGKGFTAAGKLKVGDEIETRSRTDVTLSAIVLEHRDKAAPVYNLTIEGDHSYFVGKAEGGEWVHNYGGIYTFIDKQTGLPYVGKAVDLPVRTGYWSSVGRPGSLIGTLAFPAGTSNLALRIAEQQMMNSLGGVGKLANKINSVAPKYWVQYGISPP